MRYVGKIGLAAGLLFCMCTVHAENDLKFTLWSGNCYAFPPKLVKYLKRASKKFASKEVDLVAGITKSIDQRINEIAFFVNQRKPDVVVFQELWKDDNKNLMTQFLSLHYPYIYWVSMETGLQPKEVVKSAGKFLETLFTDPAKLGKSDTYVELNPLKLDSGLFLASKFPLIKTGYVTYKDRGGDEVNANKGALIAMFNDRQGNPVLLAVTHLQSWRDLAFVSIRHKQMRQLGKFLTSDTVQHEWARWFGPQQSIQVQPLTGAGANVSIGRGAWDLKNVKNLTTVIVGDFNEPITYQKAEGRLIDRGTSLAETLQSEGVNVSHDAVLAKLKRDLGIKEYIKVREITNDAIVTTGVDTATPSTYAITQASSRAEKLGSTNSLYNTLGRFYDKKDGKQLYDYFLYTTDARGVQLLDYLLLDPHSTIGAYEVMRDKILGDQGPGKPYNADTAVSDHAHIFVEIRAK